MLGYALRRLFLAIPLLLGITFISFLVIHLAPGEPAEIQTGDLSVQSDAQARQLLRELYDLDKPLHVQYTKWLTRIVRLDFGKSFSPDSRPVLQKIGERLPVTLLLNIIEMLVIVVLAVPIGVLAARPHRRQRHRRVDLRDPGHGAAHGAGRVRARLSGDHGEPRHRRHAHARGEPRRRCHLQPDRSTDPRGRAAGTPLTAFWRALRRNSIAQVGGLVVVCLILLALLASVLVT